MSASTLSSVEWMSLSSLDGRETGDGEGRAAQPHRARHREDHNGLEGVHFAGPAGLQCAAEKVLRRCLALFRSPIRPERLSARFSRRFAIALWSLARWSFALPPGSRSIRQLPGRRCATGVGTVVCADGDGRDGEHRDRRPAASAWRGRRTERRGRRRDGLEEVDDEADQLAGSFAAVRPLTACSSVTSA